MENLTYNSQLEKLIIPEYGRNVQTLIRHANDIEDLDERQFFVEKVVHLMMQMHPQNKNLDDYRDKMWKHVFRIADYKLEGVIPPNGKIPTPEDSRKRPDKVPYPEIAKNFRHYGLHVQTLINKALTMEEGDIKKGFVQVIGSYMKLAYRTWNKDHYVSDEQIVEDLESLSNGKLELDEDAPLDTLTHSNQKKNRNSSRDNRGDYRERDGRNYRDNRGGRDRRGSGSYDRDSRGGSNRSYDRGGRRDNRNYRDNRGGRNNNYDRRRR